MDELPPVPPTLFRTPPRSPDEIEPLVALPKEPFNTLGLVAFLASLVGFCLPLVPSGIALVLGIIAVWRRPRGFAIAAIVLSVLQVGGWIAWAILLAGASGVWGGMQSTQTVQNGAAVLRMAIVNAEDNHIPLLKPDGTAAWNTLDSWGTMYRITIVGPLGERKATLWSAGPDQTFDTGDDFQAAMQSIDESLLLQEPKDEERP